MHCDMLKIQDGVAIVEKLNSMPSTQLFQSFITQMNRAVKLVE